MSTSIAALKDAINEVRFNPAAIQRRVFETLESVTNGKLDIVDPSNPFVFLLEASSVLTAAQIEENENLTRQLYPSMALTEKELYLHMSDFDYIGRFATPARTTFTLLFNKDELIKRAVQTDHPYVRKLTIPRNTEFKVSDYTFTLEYPIDMRVMHHGGLQIVYDTTRPSPLQTLESNLVDWSLIRLKNEEFVQLRLPVNQWVVTPHYAHINRSVSYVKTFNYTDQYHYCRIYRAHNGGWNEIRTTHTDQVFDPYTPTAVLTTLDQRLQVYIPQIYISNKTLDKELRIDIYTTKGPLDLILDSYDISSFHAVWRDLNKADSRYSAPLNVYTSMGIYSDSVVTGGSHALSFDALRERVITNALGNMQLPITEQQLDARLSNLGYQSVRDVDNITNRVYLATRRLPEPTRGQTLEAAGSLLNTVQYTFRDLSDIRGVNTHFDWNRVTVTSNTLYCLDNGVVRFVENTRFDQLYSIYGAELINAINTEKLLTTPFYYVLDANDPYFTVRAYDLDYPVITHREFIEENTTTLLTATTKTFSVFKKPWGYLLQIVARVSKPFKELPEGALSLQLGFQPQAEHRHVFINAQFLRVLDSGDFLFQARIETTFDINETHALLVNNAQMYPNDYRDFGLELKETLTLTYGVDYTHISGDSDNLEYETGWFLYPSAQFLITREHVEVRFGTLLTHFWEQYRTVVDSIDYELYEEDVYKHYSQHVYLRHPETGTVDLLINDAGELEYTILHRAGERMLDSEGNPIVEHRRGEVKLDSDGKPVTLHPRALLREWGMFFIDARYRFVTSDDDLAYLASINKQICRWLCEDMTLLSQWALEQTTFFLYPLKTYGLTEALVGDRETQYIELEQTLSVRFFVDELVYNDEFSRETLRTIALETIKEALHSLEIQLNQIVSRLTERAGENAIAIEVKGLGGESNLSTLNLQDRTSRCSLAKELTQRLDGVYEMRDLLNVEFIQLST